jgi:hypothetical protein
VSSFIGVPRDGHSAYSQPIDDAVAGVGYAQGAGGGSSGGRPMGSGSTFGIGSSSTSTTSGNSEFAAINVTAAFAKYPGSRSGYQLARSSRTGDQHQPRAPEKISMALRRNLTDRTRAPKALLKWGIRPASANASRSP